VSNVAGRGGEGRVARESGALARYLKSIVAGRTILNGSMYILRMDVANMNRDAMETTYELFLASFEGDYDDEAAWEAVQSLRRLDSDEVFQLAVAYSRSEVPKHRARALDVLAQLGAGKQRSERQHFDESVAIALAGLSDEDAIVVHSAAWALAHLNDDRAITALIEMRNHHDPDVRWAVAVGMANSERSEAIATLIELIDDGDDDVRNWATFQLGLASGEDGSGRLGTLDSSEIRDAFRKRIEDSFAEVRDEAIWGLARRKDPTGLRLLLGRLDSEQGIAGDEMVAAEILERNYDTPIGDLRDGLRRIIDAE
jgi:HEAT repeat protein